MRGDVDVIVKSFYPVASNKSPEDGGDNDDDDDDDTSDKCDGFIKTKSNIKTKT